MADRPLDYETPPPPPDKPPFWPRRPTTRGAVSFVVLFTVFMGWVKADDHLRAMGWPFWQRTSSLAVMWFVAEVVLRLSFGPKR